MTKVPPPRSTDVDVPFAQGPPCTLFGIVVICAHCGIILGPGQTGIAAKNAAPKGASSAVTEGFTIRSKEAPPAPVLGLENLSFAMILNVDHSPAEARDNPPPKTPDVVGSAMVA